MSSYHQRVALKRHLGDRCAKAISYLKNLQGTVRRYYLTHLRAAAVKRSHALRHGECNRCGVCCQLVVSCIFLRWENGLAACVKYGKHPPNCSQFPLNQADIDDVNRISTNQPCGYFFTPPSPTTPVRPREET